MKTVHNMEEIVRIFTSGSTEIFYLFFKAFAVLFSVLYLVYALVITRQTQIMNNTFTTNSKNILVFVAFLQILFALFLIFVVFTFL